MPAAARTRAATRPSTRPPTRPAARAPAGDGRARLVAAAARLVVRHGAQGVSLREAAREAGLTHGAPYRHFPSKSALLAAVAEHGLQQLHEALLAAALATGPDALLRFQAIGLAYVRFALAQPALFRLMFSVETPDGDSLRQLATAREQLLLLCVHTIGEAQGQKRLSGGDPRALALCAWSSVHGLATLALDGALQMPDRAVHALAGRLTRTLFEGMQPQAAHPRRPASR